MVLTVENESAFARTINTSRTQLPAVLADFQKHYVMYHKNPEVNEFQNFFFDSKSQLTNINNSLFSTQNSLEKSIIQMETDVRAISLKIDAEKLKYGDAYTKQSIQTNSNNGAEQLIDDSRYLYNEQYKTNVELIVGVVVVFSMVMRCVR